MKISKDIHSKVETKQRISIKDNSQNFQRIVQSQTQSLKHNELETLMNEIMKQGDKLVRFRSFRDLARFKHLVRSFLQKTVYNGLQLEKSHHFHIDGQSKYSIVKQVDKKLIELTEELMDEEKKAVDILGLIGEIKGLLINLYT